MSEDWTGEIDWLDDDLEESAANLRAEIDALSPPGPHHEKWVFQDHGGGGIRSIFADPSAMTMPKVVGHDVEVRKTFDSGAVRDSRDKLRYDLVPYEHTRELAKVLTMGAAKYSPRNWEKGIPFSELYASAARHIQAFLSGQMYDNESGLLHVSHACWNLMAIEVMLLREKGPELDDLTFGHETRT